MNPNYLDFEQPIAELEVKIEELQLVGSDAEMDISAEIENLRKKSTRLTEKIYANLSAWDIVKVARHPKRPYSLDYIPRIFTEFDELHGDRHFGDDKAIVDGIMDLINAKENASYFPTQAERHREFSASFHYLRL